MKPLTIAGLEGTAPVGKQRVGLVSPRSPPMRSGEHVFPTHALRKLVRLVVGKPVFRAKNVQKTVQRQDAAPQFLNGARNRSSVDEHGNVVRACDAKRDDGILPPGPPAPRSGIARGRSPLRTRSRSRWVIQRSPPRALAPHWNILVARQAAVAFRLSEPCAPGLPRIHPIPCP